MPIYRGAGGSGDATADSSSEALLIRELVAEADADALAASASATAAAASASSASTSAINAANSAASIDVSSFLQKSNNLSDLTSASTARTNLGLGTAATTASTAYATSAQGTAADTAFADRLKWDGGATGLTAATGRTSLGLGTIATQAASSVDISGGIIIGITDLTVADGGTGASTASNARTNLGAASSGANSDITSLTGLTTALSSSQGGTGLTSAGSLGNILTSNGTAWVSSAPAGGGQQFSIGTRTDAQNSKGTPLVWNSTGSLTWTAPSGVTNVKITAIGGGTGINNYGGFNGAGGLGIGYFTVTPGTAYSITIGAAGAGLTGLSPTPAGGTTSFGSLISATGGSGGSGGGTSGSSSAGNFLNSAVNVTQPPIPFGGATTTVDGSGGRSATLDWAKSSGVSPYYTPGAVNPNNGYSVSGAILIEWIG